MDTDVSHSVQALFNAVHERLDALEERVGLKKEDTSDEVVSEPHQDVTVGDA